MNVDKKHIIANINRLYSPHILTGEEIEELEQWIQNAETDAGLERYLKGNWDQARNESGLPDFAFAKNKRQPKPGKFNIWRAYNYAAASLLLPLLGLVLFLVFNKEEAGQKQMMAVRTELGDRVHFFLPDGTEVYMNALSSLHYDTNYGVSNRNVGVTGEVFFDVHKDKTLPFEVSADSLKVEALGTQFVVRNYADEPSVQFALVEGKVRVESNNDEMILLAGAGVEYAKDKAELTKKEIDSGASLDWTKGLLVFEDDNMEQVCRKIEYWYGVSVICNYNDFAGVTFSLRLRKEESLFTLLRVMSEVMQLQYKMENNKIIINKNSI